MKDDSGSYTVFTEQGSSASQITAAKVMDIKSRLSGCAGQAADAVSASTQVKMEDAPTLLKIPKFLFKHGLEKVPNWECLFVNRQKTILICVCGRYKTGWKEAELESNIGKYQRKTLIWESQHRSLTMCFWVALLLLLKNYQKPKLQGNLRQKTISSW